MRWKVPILVGFVCLCLSLVAFSCTFMSDSTKLPATGRYPNGNGAPTTIRGILQNLKAAISAGVLLQESFYQKENFKGYFGAMEVDWRREPTPDFRSGYLLKFAIPNPPQAMNGFTLEAISATFIYRVEAGKVVAIWSLALAESSGVDFDLIESLYGHRWQLAPPELPSVHRIETVPTRPHGNSRIVYAGGDGRSSYQFLFGFYPNATLNTVEIFLERQAQQ